MPQSCDEIHVTVGRRVNDRKTSFLTYLEFVDHFLRMFRKSLWFDLIGLTGEILLSGTMPIDHHEEHGEAPKEGDDYPDKFDLGDRLAPPDAFTRW